MTIRRCEMFEKLSFIEGRFEELEKKIADPEVIADQNLWRKLCKEHSDITPIVEKYKEYKLINDNINEAKEIIETSDDKEMKELAEAEFEEGKEKIEKSSRK